MKRILMLVLMAGCSAQPQKVEPSIAEQHDIVEQPPTESEVATQLDQACVAGEAASCLSLGIRYERGDEGVPHDHDKALALYEKACVLDNASGCYAQALMLMYDKNDPIRAHLMLEHTCRSNHGPSCVMLGDLHRDGRLLRKNEEEAAKLYRQACDAGYTNGCNAYIELVWTGTRLLTDLAEFSQYLAKTCESGNAMSCEELGKLYETGAQWKGDTLKPDTEKAQALFAKAVYLRRVAGPRGWWDEVKTQPPTDTSADVSNEQPLKDPSKPGYVVVSGQVGTVVVDGVDTGIKVPGRVVLLSLGRHYVSVRKADGTMTPAKLVFVGADQGIELAF